MESATLISDTNVQLERDVHSDRSLNGVLRSVNPRSVNNRSRGIKYIVSHHLFWDLFV